MTHTDHLALAADGLRLLATPDPHPWLKVARTAAEVPLHIYEALQEHERWGQLPAADQVALTVAIVDGHLIEDRARYGPADARDLTRLAAECAAIAQWCDTSGQSWPQADPERPQKLNRAVNDLTAYHALSPMWRVHILGTLTPQRASTQRLTRVLLRAAPASPAPEPERPQLPQALAEVITHISDEAPVTTQLGRDLVQRLAHLPEAWQVHVMRRLGDQVTPLDAISAALQSRNIARNRFGITDPTPATSGTPTP